MGFHVGLCVMGSFVSLVKSDRLNEANKGDWEIDAIVMCENTNFWLGRGLVCDVPCYVLGRIPVWDTLLCPLGVVGGVVCGVVLGDRPGFPTTTAPMKEKIMIVEVLRL